MPLRLCTLPADWFRFVTNRANILYMKSRVLARRIGLSVVCSLMCLLTLLAIDRLARGDRTAPVGSVEPSEQMCEGSSINGVDLNCLELESIDNDSDNIADQVDNCVGFPNPDQRDHDNNGKGDACQ